MKIRMLSFAAALAVGCGTHVQQGVALAPAPTSGAFLSRTGSPESRSNVFASNGAGVRRIDAELLSEARD